MDKSKEKALNDFVDLPDTDEEEKKVVMNEREGLVERLDKVYVTNDGRQLLREQY